MEQAQQRIASLIAERRVADRLSAVEWLICAVAGMGFLFDTYEIVVQGIVVRPALIDLGLIPGSAAFNRWVGWVLYLPFLAGGVVGLLGGYLTDRLGRRRVLVWSIGLYGVATIGAAQASTPQQLLIWRCITIIGVSAEWIAATAWMAELFNNSRRREAALGFTQAFGAAGVFLIGIVYFVAVTYGEYLPAIHGSHAGWRYSLIFGALPVVPVLLARLLLPESSRWRELKLNGTSRRPSFRELFRPAYRRITITASLMVAAIYCAAFGVVQHMPRIVPGLPQVRLLSHLQQEQLISLVHLMQDFGGIVGRFALACLAITWLARRRVLLTFQLPALFVLPLVFATAPYLDLRLLAGGALLTGILLHGQISFIGNYLPQMYPVQLRGTGESFAISIGGRIVGTSTALLTTWLANFSPGTDPAEKLAWAAAAVALVGGCFGLLITRFLPNPQHNAS
jgi:MFS family permease